MITLGFSSFTIIDTDVGSDTASEGGGISSMLPESARSSMVEKLLKADFSRFEDGDMLCCSPVSHIFQTLLVTIPRSPQHARLVLVVVRWRPFRPCMEKEKEHGAQMSCRFSHVVFHLPHSFLDIAFRDWVSNCPVDLHGAFDTSCR